MEILGCPTAAKVHQVPAHVLRRGAALIE